MQAAIGNRWICRVFKGEGITEHIRTRGQAIGQNPVIVQKSIRQPLKTDLNLVILFEVLLQMKRRSPVWFGK